MQERLAATYWRIHGRYLYAKRVSVLRKCGEITIDPRGCLNHERVYRDV